MDFGVHLGHGTQADGSGVRQIARCADELGFHSVWCSEHFVIPMDYESRYMYARDGKANFDHNMTWGTAMVTLGHVAAVTERVRLSTCVIPMIAHHPVTLAKDAATVDALSGGRLEIGIGAGWLREEAEIVGLPSDRGGARLEEAIRLMRTAWSSAPYEFSGEFWRVPPSVSRPLPPQGANLPIWIGGTSSRALKIISDNGHGAIMPRAERAKLADVRAVLPDNRRVGIGMKIRRGFDVDATISEIREMEHDGADLIVLHCEDDAALTVESVQRFAEMVMPLF